MLGNGRVIADGPPVAVARDPSVRAAEPDTYLNVRPKPEYRSSRYELAQAQLPYVRALTVLWRDFLTAACLVLVGAAAIGCSGTGCSATLTGSIDGLGTGSVWTFGAACSGSIGVSCCAAGTGLVWTFVATCAGSIGVSGRAVGT